MPIPAEEVWRPYSERLQVQLANVTDQYLIVRGSPGYWRGKRVNTLERRIRYSIQQTDDIVEQFYSNDLREAFFRGQVSVAPELDDLLPENERFLAQMAEASKQRITIANRRLMRNTGQWGDMVRDHPKGQRGLLTKLRDAPVKAAPHDLAERSFQPGRYPELTIISDANRAYNLGVIAGGGRQGAKYVRVADGTGCGLAEHDDPNKADGLILKLDVAAQYPIAHPNCQRTFVIDDETRKRKRSGRSSKASTTAARVAVGIGAAATAGMLTLRYNKAVQRQLTMWLARNSQEFASHHARWLQNQVDDTFHSDTQIRDAAQAEWEVFYGQDVSAISKGYLRVPELKKVVGLDFDPVTDYSMSRRYEVFGTAAMNFENSVAKNVFDLIPTQVGNVDLALPRIFSSYPSLGARYRDYNLRFGKVSRFDGEGNPIAGDFYGLRGSFSKNFRDLFKYGYARSARNSHGIPYIGITPHQLVRYRLSKVKHGFANRLILNPNGMLRAGFAIDPRNGYIIPNLALIPKGPLRINTYLNRAPGRPTQGSINVTRLKRAFRKTSEGALTDAPTVGMEDVLSRGLGSSEGRLRVKDFDLEKLDNLLTVAVPGQAYEDHIIGYAIIRNALDTGEELHDLVIRNGKFQTKVILGTGRITSVSTDVRLMLPKSAVASIRFNTNLRQLGLDSLKDIRHLRWNDLRHLPQARTRVVSMALELRAMRYTPLEISKVLRLKYEDVVSMIHDGDTWFLEAGLRQLRENERFVPMRWRADLYEYFTKELAERDARSVTERLDITKNQLDRIWEKAESTWGRLPYHGELVEDAPLSSELIDTASMILSLTRDEIGEVIYVPGTRGLNRADVIRDRAAAVLMKETVRTTPEMAEYWGRAVFTNDPAMVRGYDKGRQYVDDVRARISNESFDDDDYLSDKGIGPVTDEMVADIAAGYAIALERFPGLRLPTRIRIGGPATEELSSSFNAAYDTEADELLISGQFGIRWRSFDEKARYYDRIDPTWSATAPNPITTIVHELGHVVHLSGQTSTGRINSLIQEFLLGVKYPGRPLVVTKTSDEAEDISQIFIGNSMTEMSRFMNLYFDYNPWMREVVKVELGEYAATDFWELVAESFSKTLTNSIAMNLPSNITRIMQQTWKETH